MLSRFDMRISHMRSARTVNKRHLYTGLGIFKRPMNPCEKCIVFHDTPPKTFFLQALPEAGSCRLSVSPTGCRPIGAGADAAHRAGLARNDKEPDGAAWLMAVDSAGHSRAPNATPEKRKKCKFYFAESIVICAPRTSLYVRHSSAILRVSFKAFASVILPDSPSFAASFELLMMREKCLLSIFARALRKGKHPSLPLSRQFQR